MFRKVAVFLLIAFANASTQVNETEFQDSRPLCPCGNQRLDTRIVGGHNAGQGHFPYATALLDMQRREMEEVRFRGRLHTFCGATLITDSHVLTAAHCLKGRKAEKIALDIADYDLDSSNGEIRRVVKAVKFPTYHDGSFYTDIAVLQFAPPIRWKSGVRAAILPPPNLQLRPGTIVSAYGWGRLQYKGYTHAEVLQQVDLPVVENEVCQRKFKSHIEEHMLCAGGSAGHDACIGDSGSGLVQRVGNVDVIVGVVSFGIECALPSVAGVYTRVPSFSGWIWQQTLQASCRPCFADLAGEVNRR